MPVRSIPTIVLLTTLGAACGGSSSAHSASAVAPERQGGALPSPQAYAAAMDAKERYWWQQPEQVVELLECEAGMTAVDLGAGTGYFVSYLSKAVGPSGRVHALDLDRSMVDLLYRRIKRDRLYNVSAGVVPADDPSLTPRSVDRVLIVNTWHHLSNRVAYAEKLLPAMRPGGLVLIVDFEESSPKGPPPEFRLEEGQVVAELESAGFSAHVLEESLPYQYAIAARIP